MKTKFNAWAHLATFAAVNLTLTPAVFAAEYYWDTNGTAAGFGNAVGTWGISDFWSTSATGVGATANTTITTADEVFFGTNASGFGFPGGTISIDGTVNVNKIRFGSASRAITLSGGGIDLGGTTPTVSTNASGVTHVINSVLSGSAGLTKTGTGILSLTGSSGSSGLTGGLFINGGTLAITKASDGAAYFSNPLAITLAGGSLTQTTTNVGGTTYVQDYGNVTVNAGGSAILVNSNGQVSATANLGTITATAPGSSLLIGKVVGGGTGTNTVTTTSGTLTNGIYGGRMVHSTGTAATGFDWATTVSAGPTYTLSGLGTYTAMPVSDGLITENYNITAAVTTTLEGSFSVNSLKLANNAQTLALGANLLTIESGGILSTGATNNVSSTISGTAGGTRLTVGAGSNYDLIVHQYAVANGLTISAVIGDNGENAVNFVKAGTAQVLLSGENTYTGDTYINSGLLTITGSMTSFGNNERNIYIAPGASIRRNTFDAAFYARLVQTDEEVGLFTSNAAANIDLTSTGANLPNAFLGNWAGNGAQFAYTGLITPANNTYRIGFQGTSGIFGIGSSATAANSLIGDNNLIVGGGRVALVGVNHTFTGTTTIRTGGRLTLSNNLALQNSILDLGSSGGVFAMQSANGSHTGALITNSPVLGGLMGSRSLFSAFSATSGGNNEAVQPATAILGFTLNVGAGKSPEFTGAIGGFGTGAAGGTGGAMTLTKTGDGTQILTGTHTYTGATTINGGTLDLGTTGSIAASTSLVLGPAGTLDTTDQTATYVIPASQPVTFGIDSSGSGFSGKIVADELNVSSATVTYDIPVALDDLVYVLATYTAGNLTGTFLSAPPDPSGYELDYDYEGNKIALVSTGAPTGFAAWQAANGGAGFTGGIADDHDNDGVDNGTEFFIYGPVANSSFTALPGVDNSGGTLSVTWTKATGYTGTYGTDFVVETSDTLTGTWTPEIVSPNLGFTVVITGNDVKYTFPAGTKNFARLKVTGP